MTDSEIIDLVKHRIKDPKKITTMAESRAGAVYAPAPIDLIADAEKRLGFALPSLLSRMYLEIGNGGFGPAYGLYGLRGGLTSELADAQPIPELYLQLTELDAGEYSWPKRWLPICDWGCCIESVIDCSTGLGRMIFIMDGINKYDEEITFAQWMADWAKGIDLWERATRIKRKLEV